MVAMNQPGDDRPRGFRMPDPDLTDVDCAIGGSSTLRLAVHALLHVLPEDLKTDSVRGTLNELRDRLDQRELQAILVYGPREYLLIKPLAPDAGGAFADQAAQHVQALADLGLIVRLDL